MSTPVGEKGRLPQGESWQRALDTVRQRLAQGSKSRYRIRGRRIEQDWWAYEATRISTWVPPVKTPGKARSLTKEDVAELALTLSRCAQRARAMHGGETKVAWPTQALAYRAAAAIGGRVYECPLPAPAIGRHWHITTSKKPKRRT